MYVVGFNHVQYMVIVLVLVTRLDLVTGCCGVHLGYAAWFEHDKGMMRCQLTAVNSPTSANTDQQLKHHLLFHLDLSLLTE